MKLLSSLLALAFIFTGCAHHTPPLPTAARVDLSRYAGRWFEVARLPNPFQRADAQATAEYTVLPDGRVKVLNTERRPDGRAKSIEGRAVAVPGSGNARLRVKFSGLAALAPVPAEGNYWIIQLEPDYSAALVGTPDRKYLWLLARSPQPNPKTRSRLITRARELGFAVDRLIPATAR